MLKFLFSNANIEKILLFLFVNEKGYGSQIRSLLNVPLTPVQNALSRLERGEIVLSSYEGNKKVYQLNTAFPLFEELESLLKKAYTLLSPQDKKHYCYIHKPRLTFREELQQNERTRSSFKAFWKKLMEVRELDFRVKSKNSKNLEHKIGKAKVRVTLDSPTQLIFTEQGYWYEEGLPKTAFSNQFRWNLDLNMNLITLEHLRHGPQNPTFLFHLTLHSSHSLVSLDAHLCHQDTYLGALTWSPKAIDFNWRVIGPKKNQFLHYHYKP